MKLAIILVSAAATVLACGGGDAGCTLDRPALLDRVEATRGERLEWSGQLEAAASAHAHDLAAAGRVAHEGPDGSLAPARARRAGWPSEYVGENVAGGPGIGTEQDAMDLWEASAGHLANIRWPAYTHVGVACVTADRDYWVQVFGRDS